MKKIIALLLAIVMVFALAACGSSNTPGTASPNPGTSTPGTDTPSTGTPDTPAEPKKVGFVTIGDGDFFNMLANAYVEKMTALGWEASFESGKFDPATQITAAENYIAMGVDVLVMWAVAPEAINSVVDQAMERGIKFIAFVAETEHYDVVMKSDDAVLAAYGAKLAAQWIDEAYADAPDHSVPVAVLSCRAAQTGVLQADVLLKIADYSVKAGKVIEVECESESASLGMNVAENLYITNPEIKVFLSAHNGLAQGISNYYTGISSPVTDYSDMGIFCINGDTAVYDMIKASVTNENPLRGTVMTGSVDDTANELVDMITGLIDGTIPSGHVQMAGTLFIYDETIDEFLTTGTVTSVTNADFD